MSEFIVIQKSQSIEEKVKEVLAVSSGKMALTAFETEVKRRVGFTAYTIVTGRDIMYYLGKNHRAYWLKDGIIYQDDDALEDLKKKLKLHESLTGK